MKFEDLKAGTWIRRKGLKDYCDRTFLISRIGYFGRDIEIYYEYQLRNGKVLVSNQSFTMSENELKCLFKITEEDIEVIINSNYIESKIALIKTFSNSKADFALQITNNLLKVMLKSMFPQI